MSDAGISGYGTTIEGGSGTGALAEIISISIGGMSRTDIDLSTMDSSNAYKQFIGGMIDAGEVSLSFVYEKGNHDAMQDALTADNELWTITLPDGSTFSCDGYMKNVSMEIPMDDKISQSATLKLSGEPTFTPASA
jgi:hypothetical protein